ncbi:MAG: hypothetical protein O2954_19140 [bacterium]|nr:hypothetical protein [bacterium]
MKRILLLTHLCLLVWCVPVQAADLRTGGGIILDKSIWGGGIALDLHMANRLLTVSLHTDHFNSALFFTSFFGASVLARAEVSEDKTAIFLGGGVGGSRVREKLYSQTTVAFIVQVVARITHRTGNRLGVFAEIRYNLNVSKEEFDSTGLLGLSWKLGK